MSDELKLGKGILAQIMEQDNVRTYKPIDFNNPEEVKDLRRRWKEFCKEEDERMKNYIPDYPAQLLMSYPDDIFISSYNSQKVRWIGGIDIIEAIEKRAKKLGIKTK